MNFEDIYKENTMIICHTRDESDRYRQFLSEYGVKWGSGRGVMERDFWKDRTTIIGYVFHEWDPGVYRAYYDTDGSMLDYAAERGYTIVMFDELNIAKAPTKEFDTSSLMELYQ